MQQLRLLQTDVYEDRTVVFDNIKAVFTKVSDDSYDVFLEINSNKFLINLKTFMERIERFEIIAVKGFVELSMSILKLIKKIVYKLYFEA